MNEETRICHYCNAIVTQGEFCPICTEDIPNWPDPDTMTSEARLSEWDSHYGPLEVPFGNVLHPRLEKLVGRPVWTHELASPKSREHLRQEVANRLNYDGNYEQAATKALDNIPQLMRHKFFVFDADEGACETLDEYEKKPDAFDDLDF